jgi:hypothetical protein
LSSRKIPRWKLQLARFMRAKPICNVVFWIRFVWFVRIRRRVRVFGDLQSVTANGFEHNQNAIWHGRPSDRILKLIMPMSVIDRLNAQSEVLAIGVRYETDLLYLMAYGLPNCRGLDLFSYSPWVDLGNMHAMPYGDNSFDAVLMGWTLAYSDDQRKAAAEIVRVGRNGGVVALSNSYYPPETLDRWRLEGQTMGLIDRRQTTAAILELFGSNVERVYFQHDPNPTRQGACVVIFSIKKGV